MVTRRRFVIQYILGMGLLLDPRAAPGVPMRLPVQAAFPASRLAFSPDGAWIAAGTEPASDRSERRVWLTWLWNVRTRRLVARLAGSFRAFSPDSRLLATVGDTTNKTGAVGVTLWATRTGRRRAFFPHPYLPRDLVFSPDGRLLATGGEDGVVRLWDLRTAHLTRVLRGHTMGVSCLAFSPDGRLLASAGQNGVVRLWEPWRGRLRRTLRGHTNGVLGLVYAPDGAYLVSGGWDHTIRLWQGRTGTPLATARYRLIRSGWPDPGPLGPRRDGSLRPGDRRGSTSLVDIHRQMGGAVVTPLTRGIGHLVQRRSSRPTMRRCGSSVCRRRCSLLTGPLLCWVYTGERSISCGSGYIFIMKQRTIPDRPTVTYQLMLHVPTYWILAFRIALPAYQVTGIIGPLNSPRGALHSWRRWIATRTQSGCAGQTTTCGTST